MADINLFRGGSTPLASLGAECNCGPYPSTYPAPNRVAVHMRDQRFTVAASLAPAIDPNMECILCANAGTTEEQTANIIDKKMGLIRVPVKHLLSAIRMVLDPGNGAGASFDVYVDRVNPVTGAVVSAVTMPAAAAGNTLAAARDELYLIPSTVSVAASGNAETLAVPSSAGVWSGDDVLEIGVKFTAGPTTGTLCTWDGRIDLVAKVDGFDYGKN